MDIKKASRMWEAFDTIKNVSAVQVAVPSPNAPLLIPIRRRSSTTTTTDRLIIVMVIPLFVLPKVEPYLSTGGNICQALFSKLAILAWLIQQRNLFDNFSCSGRQK
jgi:hypothetical protein